MPDRESQELASGTVEDVPWVDELCLFCSVTFGALLVLLGSCRDGWLPVAVRA